MTAGRHESPTTVPGNSARRRREDEQVSRCGEILLPRVSISATMPRRPTERPAPEPGRTPNSGQPSMQYMILIYGDEKAFANLSQEDMGKAYGAYMAYSKELAQAGVLVGGASLQPIATATTVRVKNGKTTTTDGPFAETKEQLGGYYIVDCPDLDAALKWAARCPGASHGCCEVRPLGIISAADGGIAAMQQ